MTENGDNAPATRGDLKALEQRLKQEITAAMLESEARIASQTEQRLERMETTMLREFHNYVEGARARIDLLGDGAHSFDKRLSILESKVLDIEGRIRKQS